MAKATAKTAMAKATKKTAKASGAKLGFEATLWKAADKLRNNMDAAEYKHVVLGLIFLKYISDAFEEKHAVLAAEVDQGADPEDPDEYRAENIFWVPKAARWTTLQGQAKQPKIGKLIDDAMVAIEKDNRTLKGVLPKNYARPALDKRRLGELIDLVGTIGLGDEESRSKDVLGRVYEYFLTEFASAEGKNGGQFYTPRSVVHTLVTMLAPYRGRVLDPACGSGRMFVQSEKFIEAHGGRIGDISVYGQESNPTTWRLAKMNLAIRQAMVEADLVDCMVALPGQLFYSTQIPVCLWFLTRDKRNGKGQEGRKLRDRRDKTLFIDARKLGTLVDRVHRELTEEDIGKIAGAYHNWRGDGDGKYEDVAGFCKESSCEEIGKHDFVLTPGRYVGAEEAFDDGIPFEDKMAALSAELRTQFSEGAKLEKKIETALQGLGFGE